MANHVCAIRIIPKYACLGVQLLGCHKSSWSMKSSTPCNMHKLYKINQIDTIRDVVSTGLRKGILCSHLILPFKCPLHLSTDCLAEKRILLNRRWFTPSRQLSLKGYPLVGRHCQQLSSCQCLHYCQLQLLQTAPNFSQSISTTIMKLFVYVKQGVDYTKKLS